jgi:hypothetical protein
VRQWRKKLAKYSKFPGISKKHNFLLCSVQEMFLAKTRVLGYTGSLENATIKVSRGRTPKENVIPTPEESYTATNRLRETSTTKLGHLQQMFNFIPAERHDAAIMQ